MTKEQYTIKDEGDKKYLILQYYNRMVKGNFLLFVVCVLSVICFFINY